jgi:hypothetical protein
LNWLGCNSNSRLPVIDGSELLAILSRLLPLLHLRGHGRNTLFACGGEFGGGRLASDAAGSVVAGAGSGVVDGPIVNDRVGYGAVVGLDVIRADVIDGTVVVEAISPPVSALITGPGVTISIINTAVVADVRAPIAVVITVAVAAISPISWGPKIAGFGW